MLILDTLLIGGLRFVLDQVAAAVDAELHDDTALREELLAAQMRLELGEIDEEEFARIESDLLPRLRQLRPQGTGDVAAALSSGEYVVTGVDATIHEGER